MTRDPDYGPKFVMEFQDKLLFGTDIITPESEFPMIDLLKDWKDTGKITGQAFAKIARENAIKLLDL